MKKIYWISELPFNGKVSREHKNMRTEFAWMSATQAEHINMHTLRHTDQKLGDLGIIIIPKDFHKYGGMNLLEKLKTCFTQYAFMQEGPAWLYQDLPVHLSFEVLSIMSNASFFLSHNERDLRYYKGLLGIPGHVNRSLLLEDNISDIKSKSIERSGVIIGGNFVSWYRGLDSFILAQKISDTVHAPSMGRKQNSEQSVEGLKHLPYLEWSDWMKELNKFKYAVHMMDTPAAGTFSLNCAYLGIPCVGSIFVDTQRLCFPEISVDPYDMESASKLVDRLRDDEEFYTHVSKKAVSNWRYQFSERAYLERWKEIIQNLE